jgi:hypothetical protein
MPCQPHPAATKISGEDRQNHDSATHSREHDLRVLQQPGGPVLWQDDFCRVVRVDEPDYPGFCRVIVKRHAASSPISTKPSARR